jgi:hypothetical protein
MADQEIKEVDDETRARGGKRTSENKITEVSTSKSKKRAKKAPAESPKEPTVVQNLFEDSFKHSEEYLKRSRLERAARDVADGKITLEELDQALHNAVTERNIRLADQEAFTTFLSCRDHPNFRWKDFAVRQEPSPPAESALPSACAKPNPSRHQVSN